MPANTRFGGMVAAISAMAAHGDHRVDRMSDGSAASCSLPWMSGEGRYAELSIATHQRHPLSPTGRHEAVAQPPKACEGGPAERIGNIKSTIIQNARKAPCVVLTPHCRQRNLRSSTDEGASAANIRFP